MKIEAAGRSLMIDIGTLATQSYSLNDFGAIDAVLFTHRHPDHFDPAIVKPVTAAGISLHDAYRYIQTVQAGTALLVHYDIAELNPDTFELFGGGGAGARLYALKSGETVDLS